MIKRLDSLEMFGKSESPLSERSKTYFGALVYMLACGHVSGDPCWAQNHGADKAVKDTLTFMYDKFSDIPLDTILSEFNSVCRMVCYHIRITEDIMFRRCTPNTDCCMEDVKLLYESNSAFKSFITRVINARSPRGDFAGYVIGSLYEIRNSIIHNNCGIDNFTEIIMDFLNERDASVAIHGDVSSLIRASFISVEA